MSSHSPQISPVVTVYSYIRIHNWRYLLPVCLAVALSWAAGCCSRVLANVASSTGLSSLSSSGQLMYWLLVSTGLSSLSSSGQLIYWLLVSTMIITQGILKTHLYSQRKYERNNHFYCKCILNLRTAASYEVCLTTCILQTILQKALYWDTFFYILWPVCVCV
jgi:hypothetical protein